MIYWDHNSTTPCDPEVEKVMQPFWTEVFGNPASSHQNGQKAARALKSARVHVASLVNCSPNEIIFTSGATESNNMVFIGLLLSNKSEKQRIVTSPIEHKSILDPAVFLSEKGYDVVYLPVTTEGVVDLDAANKLITSDTVLVSIQTANNEIGTIQPIKEIARIAHKAGAFFHTDAAQAIGKIPVDLETWECDFASFSSHKIYGPKGVGALFVAGGPRRWPWPKPFRGGGQEGGLRPGTSNVASIVGFGEACRLVQNRLLIDIQKLKMLTSQFNEVLKNNFPDSIIHAQFAQKIPGTISISFKGIPADVLISNCKEYCISSGAACNAGTIGNSHVLEQIITDNSTIESTVRISLGRNSKVNDLDNFVEYVKRIRSEKIAL